MQTGGVDQVKKRFAGLMAPDIKWGWFNPLHSISNGESWEFRVLFSQVEDILNAYVLVYFFVTKHH